jgi:cytochrome c oxidase cbb3-type subunit 2
MPNCDLVGRLEMFGYVLRIIFPAALACTFVIGVAITKALAQETDTVQAQVLDLPSGVAGRDIYVQNCSICHGTDGKGDGALAAELTPAPRNLVVGNFRYRSTGFGEPPSQADLIRIITQGIEGSYGQSMPAFDTLSAAEVFALTNVVREFAGFDVFGTSVDIPPQPEARQVDLGRQLFTDNGCNQCHGDTGDGNGIVATDLRDDNDAPIRPANLQSSAFKGGNKPEDIFLRINYGIDGTPMPSFGRNLSSNEVWALTDFVVSLGDVR